MQPPPPEPLSEPLLERVTRWIAITGGLLSIATAILVTISVARRWLGFGPVPGDFELVQIGTAISVFSFLPLTQARRGNIVVDTFTAKLPARVNRTIDAVWDFVFAAFMALIAFTLMNGAREAVSSHLNSMVLGVPLAPVFAVCVILVAVLAVTALVTGLRLLRARP
jgi:TRAP-type C4-dicarboxylate transport system permease small subunit